MSEEDEAPGPEEDAGEEDEDEDESEADIGPRLGLVLVFGAGFVLGGLTGGSLWALYPPARGHEWPLGLLAGISALLVVGLYIVLRRRAGPQVADWFVLGYLGALVLGVGLVAGGAVLEFVHDRLPPGLDTGSGAQRALPGRA